MVEKRKPPTLARRGETTHYEQVNTKYKDALLHRRTKMITKITSPVLLDNFPKRAPKRNQNPKTRTASHSPLGNKYGLLISIK